MPSDLATSWRGAKRQGGGGWAASVHDLVVGGLKVGEEGGDGVEGKVGGKNGGAEGDEGAGSGGGLKYGGVAGCGRGGSSEACRHYVGGSLAGLKSKRGAEVGAEGFRGVVVEGFRARSTCLGLQVVQRAGLRRR
jgi:hypothetical protein